MTRPVSEKMGIKQGSRAFFLNVPDSVLTSMGLPNIDIGDRLEGDFDHIHFFATTNAELNETFPVLKSRLEPAGKLWVSWPKGKKLGTDLTLPVVINIGYGHGVVESTCLSVNGTWSALKFTHPKPGKTYNNSHGQLPASEF